MPVDGKRFTFPVEAVQAAAFRADPERAAAVLEKGPDNIVAQAVRVIGDRLIADKPFGCRIVPVETPVKCPEP